MDIDASINIGNEFPTSAGSSYKSADPNKWTIMPKWESPILDFPSITRTPAVPATPVAYASASITVEDYTLINPGDTFSITTSTVTVNFEFDSGTTGPSRVDATNYKMGYSAVTKNNELSLVIAATINLARTNGEIDISPLQIDAVVELTDDAGGTTINVQMPHQRFLPLQQLITTSHLLSILQNSQVLLKVCGTSMVQLLTRVRASICISRIFQLAKTKSTTLSLV
jgi:hypothetical protein